MVDNSISIMLYKLNLRSNEKVIFVHLNLFIESLCWMVSYVSALYFCVKWFRTVLKVLVLTCKFEVDFICFC